MKKLLEQIKAWFLIKKEQVKGLWLKLKAWFIKNWMIIANYFVIVMAYNIIYGHEEVIWAETLLGLWIFVSIGVAGYRLFMKK